MPWWSALLSENDCLFEIFIIDLLPVGDILKANDDLSRVIGSYKRIVEGQADNGEGDDLLPAASEGDISLGFICRSSLNCNILIIQYISFSYNMMFVVLSGCETTGTLIDLAGLDEPSSPPTVPPPSLPPQVPSTNPMASSIPVLPPPPRRLATGHGSQTSSPNHKPPEQQTSLSLLDDELLSLGNKSLLNCCDADWWPILRK